MPSSQSDISPPIEIVRADPRAPENSALIHTHIELMRAGSCPRSVHALGAHALACPEIEFYILKQGTAPIGMGALKIHAHLGGEIKSMHIIEAARAGGYGRLLALHLIARARALQLPAVYLETGIEEKFTSARALYFALGFATCPPFADYSEDENSVFMRLDL